jgi:PAS domain S-box-containing protein
VESTPSTASFPTRLWTQLVDPTVLTLAVVAPVLWVARRLHLIAATPIWFLIGLLLVAFVMSCVTSALWGQYDQGWRLWARIAEQTFGITAVMYALGWGPMLAIGLIFGAVEGIRLSGSRAVAPAMVSSVAALTLGELAIAAGVAPTLVDQPLVHGLAVLAALGVTFTIKLFGRATTQTERVEAELRQSEQRFRALVQHASDIIMVIGPQAVISYVSPAFEAILGYSSAEAVGMVGEDLAHPDDVETLRAAITADNQTSLAGDAEVRLCHRDGTWRGST